MVKHTMQDRQFPELSTNRLILRKLNESDSEDILFLRSNDKVNRYIARPRTKNREEALEFIFKTEQLFYSNKMLYWSITLKKYPEMIGTICLWNFSKDGKFAEIGYELKPSFQNMGFMSEAMECVMEFGFDQLQLNAIEAYTHRENQASKKLLNRFGFIKDVHRLDKGNLDNIILVSKNPNQQD
ncbi:MAG: GNAT family N-acetyltransferase [Allomuricauda sp.]